MSATVLLNPRIPAAEQYYYRTELAKVDLLSHVWIATSGSTGKFKFVALSKDALYSSAQAVNQYLQSTHCDVWVHCLPDFHVGGLGIAMRAELSRSKVVKLERWNPAVYYQALSDNQATLTALVPTMLYDLVVEGYRAPNDLRAVIIGGAALERSLFDQAKALGWKLIPTYGLTECSSQVATANAAMFDRFTPLDHIELKVDSDQYLWIKSEALMTTYAIFDRDGVKLDDPKKKGWLKTGDKGMMDGSQFRILGRGDNFIKICGEGVNLIHLQHLADQLSLKMGLPNSVVVYPFPDERGGYHIHLVCEGEADLSFFTRSFNSSVMPYEKIRKIHFTSELPRSAIGKILVKKIKGICG